MPFQARLKVSLEKRFNVSLRLKRDIISKGTAYLEFYGGKVLYEEWLR